MGRSTLSKTLLNILVSCLRTQNILNLGQFPVLSLSYCPGILRPSGVVKERLGHCRVGLGILGSPGVTVGPWVWMLRIGRLYPRGGAWDSHSQ